MRTVGGIATLSAFAYTAGWWLSLLLVLGIVGAAQAVPGGGADAQESVHPGLSRAEWDGRPYGSAIIELVVTNQSGHPGNYFVYRQISASPYTFEAGDRIEYDVFLPDPVSGAGGIDIYSTTGVPFRDLPGWRDQVGTSGHPGHDLSAHAYGQWYRRSLAVPAQMVGETAAHWNVVGENDTPGLTYTARYARIVVTDAQGDVRFTVFNAPEHYTRRMVTVRSGIEADAVRLLGPHGEPLLAAGSLRPFVVTPRHPTDDVVVALCDATAPPYLADPTGHQDATAAIQLAIWDCSEAGGGVVWLPAGEYKVLGNLVVAEGVVLRGDWKAPRDGDLAVGGTLLLAYAGRGSAEGVPFIALESGAGVRNLTIFYPEQTLGDVAAYPYTIEQTGYQVSTVMNVTLVNPYQGMRFGGRNNEMHYVRNVYGSPLAQGVQLDRIYDVGRIYDLHFSPAYWAESGLPHAPSQAQIAAFTSRPGGAVGIATGHNDWQVFGRISLQDLATGMRFINEGGGGNGHIYDLSIRGARVGLEFDYINPYGWSITSGSIEANVGDDAVGVLATPGFRDVSVQLHSVTFEGTGSAIRLAPGSNGLVSVVHGAFASWGEAAGGHAAVDVHGGSLSLQNSSFAESAGGEYRHLHLGPNVSSAVVLANRFADEPAFEIADPDHRNVRIDHTETAYESFDPVPYEFAPWPTPARIGPEDFYIVTDFGASGDGQTDDTAAIQRALHAAGEKGGGTVYLPGGRYRVAGNLTVPPGVELRGVHDTPHHTVSARSVLLAYAGRGDAEAAPFIALHSHSDSGGSGLRGLAIWYPEQDYRNIAPYPWAVQSRGPGNWVVDTVVANAYQGVDFASYPSDGHVIHYLGGAALKTGLAVGNTQTGGWVENVHFNPHFWIRSDLPGAVPASDWQRLWGWQKREGTGFLVNDAASLEWIGTFVFGAFDGVRLAAGPKGVSGRVIGHGTDGAHFGLRVGGVGEAGFDLINFQAVQFDSGGFVVVEETVAPDRRVRLFNTNHWTSPPVGYLVQGGDVLVQQVHFTDRGLYPFRVEGGRLRVESAYFQGLPHRHVAQFGGEASVRGSVALGAVLTMGEVESVNNVGR